MADTFRFGSWATKVTTGLIWLSAYTYQSYSTFRVGGYSGSYYIVPANKKLVITRVKFSTSTGPSGSAMALGYADDAGWNYSPTNLVQSTTYFGVLSASKSYEWDVWFEGFPTGKYAVMWTGTSGMGVNCSAWGFEADA